MPFVINSLQGAYQAGFDVNRLLKASGISPELLKQPRARVPMDDFVSLIQRLMRLMDDEYLGLMERPQRLGSFALIGRSVLHEHNVLSAIQCYVQSANLIDTGLIHFFEQSGDQVIYGLRRRQTGHSNYVVESASMTAHRFFCWLGRRRIPLLRVEFDYPAPAWAEEYRYLFYSAPVYFDRREIALVMRLADLQGPVQQNLDSLQAYVERAPRDMFTPTHNTSISHKARRVILRHFRDGLGMPRSQDVAQSLKLSQQTFWRRLRDEGVDFTQVRTRARRDVAIWMLSQPGFSIEQIAESIGYSESSAFIRAFKSWTELTPLEYRRL